MPALSVEDCAETGESQAGIGRAYFRGVVLPDSGGFVYFAVFGSGAEVSVPVMRLSLEEECIDGRRIADLEVFCREPAFSCDLYTEETMITALVGLAMAMQDVKLPEMETYTLLIFKSGTRPAGITQEALNEMQQGHLDNLGRLFNEKKAPCAGPFDNGGEFRGIVILELPKEKVAAEFESDPFVKNGLLKIELYPWTAPKGLFTYDWKEDAKMMKGTLAWVTTGNPEAMKGEELQKAFTTHINHNLDLMRNGDAGLVGPAGAADGLGRGYYLFLTDDDEKIDKLNAKDPLLKTGYFKMERKKVWMGEGLFKKLKN